MFTYYGSKKRIVWRYPPPKYSRIVEPFAGAASYAFRYFDRDVLLLDKNENVVNVWRYLQQASEKDILSLPSFAGEIDLRNFPLSEPERHLIYFCATGGGAASTGWKIRGGTWNYWNVYKPRIARQLFKIRHWKVICQDYQVAGEVETRDSTWFIDPPYFVGGHKYTPSNKHIDYQKLAEWCKSRPGQVIVCENSSGNWLPFSKLVEIKGIKNKKTTEVFWTNEKAERQACLFDAI